MSNDRPTRLIGQPLTYNVNILIIAVHKFTGTDRNELFSFLLPAQYFSYFDTVYMYRIIPGPVSMIYIFPLVYHIDTDTGAYVLPIRNVSHETMK